jgi:hypothetical protein
LLIIDLLRAALRLCKQAREVVPGLFAWAASILAGDLGHQQAGWPAQRHMAG